MRVKTCCYAGGRYSFAQRLQLFGGQRGAVHLGLARQEVGRTFLLYLIMVVASVVAATTALLVIGTIGLTAPFRLALAAAATVPDPLVSVGAWEARQPGDWPDFPEVCAALCAELT